MTNKKKIRREVYWLRRVKTWQLVIVLILFGLLSASFLRLNNIGMVERRTAVIQADKRGDDNAIAKDLYALQRYSASTMNASTGPLYLEESYIRDVKKITNSAQHQSSISAKIAQEADATCKAQYSGYSQAYVQCFVAEQNKHSASKNLDAPLQFPNPELYRHEYISPLWSPDFAGWSLLICALLVVIIIARAVSLLILKAMLRKHYKSI